MNGRTVVPSATSHAACFAAVSRLRPYEGFGYLARNEGAWAVCHLCAGKIMIKKSSLAFCLDKYTTASMVGSLFHGLIVLLISIGFGTPPPDWTSLVAIIVYGLVFLNICLAAGLTTLIFLMQYGLPFDRRLFWPIVLIFCVVSGPVVYVFLQGELNGKLAFGGLFVLQFGAGLLVAARHVERHFPDELKS